MKSIALAVLLGCAATVNVAVLPILHLDEKSVAAFDAYVAKFETQFVAAYVDSGKLWIDDSACCARAGAPSSAKPVLEARMNEDIPGGSIHHYSGALHVRGGTIEDVRRIMQDYPNYPKYFRPDVFKGSGSLEPDSMPTDEHYRNHLSLAESTLWFNVQFDCIYDTHYRWIDGSHWFSKSASQSIRELRDPKKPRDGTYPEGEDHGFLWRTNTYWFVRRNGDGIDLEADSITLSRPNIPGFAWWGAKRSHDAVDKMLRDTRTAIEAMK